MQLFKRVLLSLFPANITNNNINPASMFVSFISSKEFFSVINRKLVENYKINMFDIAIDPFEFKIGFGSQPTIKIKDVDLYYGYCATANINGYRLYNPANVSNTLTLALSLYAVDAFRPLPQKYFLTFLYTIYLLSFIFAARIKVFPTNSTQTNYNRFMEVLFSCYQIVAQQTGIKLSDEDFGKIKATIAQQTSVLQVLFTYYQKINTLFTPTHKQEKEFYTRLLLDDNKDDDRADLINQYVANHAQYTTTSRFAMTEKKLLAFILPADILVRYLYADANAWMVTDELIGTIFDKKQLDVYIDQFDDDPTHALSSLLTYITDYTLFKKTYFIGIQKYVTKFFAQEKDTSTPEEIDEFMSTIGDLKNIDTNNIGDINIPDRIKKESKLMEKLINFYVTLVGGLHIARGDTFQLRLCKPELIHALAPTQFTTKDHNPSLYYYGSLLYTYGKNLFYYNYAFENVRAGKNKFVMPHKTTNKKAYSNLYLLHLFTQNAVATLLQDCNHKDIKIYVTQQTILETFRKQFGEQIGYLTRSPRQSLLTDIYAPYFTALSDQKPRLDIVQEHIIDDDIYNIKEQLYTLDFRVTYEVVNTLHKIDANRKEQYDDGVMLHIFANIRETLLGYVLYRKFVETSNITSPSDIDDTNIFVDILDELYVKEVLHIQPPQTAHFLQVMTKVYQELSPLLDVWQTMDDNKEMFTIAWNNRQSFCKQYNYQHENIVANISEEDTIWLRGFIKNITYYNKRFVIPKEQKKG